MTYKEFLKYPLSIMKHATAQRVVIYSLAAVFILLTLSQNVNLWFPELFEIKGIKDLEYTTTHQVYNALKAILYDFLVLSSFAWFLHKYKFCVISLTAFYAIFASRLTWTFLTMSGFESITVDSVTTSILNFAWLTIIIYKISNKK